MFRRRFEIETNGRGFTELTDRLHKGVRESGVDEGISNVFIHHTSASLILCENADPSVRRDLEAFMSRWVVDGDSRFEHIAEGPDDMSAHIRSILTTSSIDVPIESGRLSLGAWQGLYLWEHRTAAHHRRITLSVW